MWVRRSYNGNVRQQNWRLISTVSSIKKRNHCKDKITYLLVREIIGVTGSTGDVSWFYTQVIEATHWVYDGTQVIQSLKWSLTVHSSILIAIILNSINSK